MELLIFIIAGALCLGLIMASWWQEEQPCSVCKGNSDLYPWECPLCNRKDKQ